MRILLDQVSKKFLGHWIIRQFHYTFQAPEKYALLGPNGSGKSTLLRIIAGMLAPTQGKVHVQLGDLTLPQASVYRHLSFCAPAFELVEEFTLIEFLHFHFQFKQALPGIAVDEIPAMIGLDGHQHKQIGSFSSGMKQRVKLAQAFFTDTPLLLLDEPCTNLDAPGLAQYEDWMSRFTQGRLVIVASNDEREYAACPIHLAMTLSTERGRSTP